MSLEAVHKTTGRLADQRRITFYDERYGRVLAPDPRQLEATAPVCELRWDPLVEEWVTLASHRQGRTFLPATDQCPLCPSGPGRQTEIPAPDYEVVVFDNRFPSFAPHPTLPTEPPTPHTPTAPGSGRCEVICFSDRHDTSFADLPPHRVRTVLDALADRTAVLSADPATALVCCFENRGEEIGVTLHHPHGQIYAYPFLPPRTERMLAAARRHATRTGGRVLYADVLAAERAAGDRVVVANEHWTAYVPAASRWPYEVHLAPHRQVPDLPALDDAERDAFGPLYLDVLRRFDALFDGDPAPYVSAWHQAPVRDGRDLSYLHLQLFTIRRAAGRLKYLAASEAAMGAFINDVAPELAAQRLRDAGPGRRPGSAPAEGPATADQGPRSGHG